MGKRRGRKKAKGKSRDSSQNIETSASQLKWCFPGESAVFDKNAMSSSTFKSKVLKKAANLEPFSIAEARCSNIDAAGRRVSEADAFGIAPKVIFYENLNVVSDILRQIRGLLTLLGQGISSVDDITHRLKLLIFALDWYGKHKPELFLTCFSRASINSPQSWGAALIEYDEM